MLGGRSSKNFSEFLELVYSEVKSLSKNLVKVVRTSGFRYMKNGLTNKLGSCKDICLLESYYGLGWKVKVGLSPTLVVNHDHLSVSHNGLHSVF